MSKTEEAVSAMESLGLTEYEARCFVALTRISKGSAKEVSQVADVPRSRVYDTVERLDRRGLVEVQQSEPREYKAVPVEMAVRRIREDHDSRLNAAENALEQIDEPESKDDEGMWAITDTEHVAERITMFLDDAESSIHFIVADDGIVDRNLLDRIRRADERGVDVLVEVATEEMRDRIQESISEAYVVVETDLETTSPVYGERPGQLLLVDGQAIVAAGVQDTDLPDVTQEMAVWTYGRDHGFAVWIRELLDDRLERRDLDR